MSKKFILILILLFIFSGSVYANSELQSQLEFAKIKLNEHQKILEDYEDHPYVYGRQGLDLRSHTTANIRYYEELIKDCEKELLTQ